MTYLGVHTIDKFDLADFYIEIRNGFLNSEAIVGTFQSKEVSVKDLVADVNKINNQKLSSLERATAVNRIRDIFASNGSKNISTYFTEDVFGAVNNFIDLVNFFSEIKGDEIYDLVNVFMHPELEEKVVVPTVSNPPPVRANPQMVTIERPPEEVVIAPPQALVNPPRQKKEPEAKVEKVKKMTHAELKEQIENQFRKDQKGQFVNIPDVLRELERLAAKYGDDRIRDLYIYNEKDGRFEWNEELFKK